MSYSDPPAKSHGTKNALQLGGGFSHYPKLSHRAVTIDPIDPERKKTKQNNNNKKNKFKIKQKQKLKKERKKKKTVIGEGGHSPEKGIWRCAALKTPVARLSCGVTRQPNILPRKSTIFRKKLQFITPKAPIWPRISLKGLKKHKLGLLFSINK